MLATKSNVREFEISSSPHIHRKLTVNKIMMWVCVALAPTCIFGIFQYGFRALLVLLVSVATAVICEWLFSHFVFKKDTMTDLSAVVTGLIIGANMPSTVPLFIPFLASAFAIIVAKEVFGGLGQNFANPAVVGRIFVFFSFTTLMSAFAVPKTLSNSFANYPIERTSDSANSDIDSLSFASPLTEYKTALSAEKLSVSNLKYLEEIKYPCTNFAKKISNSTGISPYTVDAFFGNKIGCIGEISAILILLGGIFLIVIGIASWHIPVFFLLSYGIIEWIFGGFVFSSGAFSGNPLYSILTGGIMFSAFFMATDMVTTPITNKGKVIFAVALGFFTFLFRRFSSLPEGASVALLLSNVLSPTIDKFCKNKVYGVVKEKRGKKK